jgi:hypothetical protein
MGMNLGDLAQLVGDKVGKSDSDSLALIKRFLKQRYQTIYDRSLWRDSLMMFSATVSANQSTLVLPYYAERAIALRLNPDRLLTYEENSHFFQVNPAIFEQTGTPTSYSELTPVSVQTLPSAATSLRFSSDSASDTAVSIKVYGETDTAGTEARETIALNGTATITSINSYLVPITIATTNTKVGTVTVTDGTSTMLSLWPEDTERKYARIRLHQVPDAAQTFFILAKRKIRPLTTDQDTPVIRGIEDCLLALAQADMLMHMRQYNKGQLMLQEAGVMMDKAWQLEHEQSGSHYQLNPDSNGEWNRNDWE